MKLMTAILGLVMSTMLYAGQGETRQFSYDGSQNEFEFILRGAQTHTEYRVEQVPDTCYRTVFMGYRTVCNGGPYCPIGRPGCYNYPGRTCHQQPVYRTEAYRCMRTVSIPYEVEDYKTEAKVQFSFNVADNISANERFIIKLEGENLTLAAQGSRRYVIVKNSEVIESTLSGDLKSIDAKYEIQLVEAAPLMRAISMSRAHVNGQALEFDLGAGAENYAINHKLIVDKAPRVGRDTRLLEKMLMANDMTMTSSTNATLYSVDLNAQGVTLESGRYRISIEASYASDGVILNQEQFSEGLTSKKTILYSL
jgi:hypothetical protein